jgi:hypothetical protein
VGRCYSRNTRPLVVLKVVKVYLRSNCQPSVYSREMSASHTTRDVPVKCCYLCTCLLQFCISIPTRLLFQISSGPFTISSPSKLPSKCASFFGTCYLEFEFPPPPFPEMAGLHNSPLYCCASVIYYLFPDLLLFDF